MATHSAIRPVQSQEVESTAGCRTSQLREKTTLRVLIVGEEASARKALANLLHNGSDVQSCDSAHDADEALDRLARGVFDVLLIDMKMPERSGLALKDRLKQIGGSAPLVVFLAGYDEHVVTSSQWQAAFRRDPDEKAGNSPRIAFKWKGRTVFIDPCDVMAVQAQGNYVLLIRRTDSYLLRESISVMAEKLKRYGFVRIHRSVLVNSSFVESIQPWLTGEYGLCLRGGKEYTVSRTFKKNLRSLAELWIGNDVALNE